MPSNLVSVVEEFRRSSEVQYRKNAVTALAVIADEEATTQLAEVALTDVELSVRERAEQEILTLETSAQERAIETLKRGLEDTKKRQTAYGILGRLRSKGLSIRFSRRPLLTWIRLNLGLNRHLYPLRNWKFRVRSWKNGILGGVAGVGFLLIFFLRTGSLADYFVFIAFALGLLLLSPAVAILATQRTNPINLYLDHLIGFLVEVLSTLVFASVGFILIFFFYLFLGSGRGEFSEGWILLLPIFLGTLAGLVRGGTLVAYGRFQDKRRNWLAQVVVGVGTAFLALTIVNFLAWIINPYNKVMGPSWIFYLTMSFVTANAFASIDNETYPIRPLLGRIGTLLCILILLPPIVITGYVFRLGRNAYDNERGPSLDRVFEKVMSNPVLPPHDPTPTPSPEESQEGPR